MLRELNILEVYSNISALVTIFAGSLYISDVGNEGKMFAFLLIILVNTIFTVKWLFEIFDILFFTYEKTISKCFPCVIDYFTYFKKTLDDTRFDYNLPRFLYRFWRNFLINKRKFPLVKLNF